MYLKLIPKLVFAALLILAVFPVFSQVGPAATERTFPLSVGAGFSGFESGYGAGLLMGGSLWVDYTPPQVPRIIQGIGVEAEARDLNFHRAPDQPQNLRMTHGPSPLWVGALNTTLTGTSGPVETSNTRCGPISGRTPRRLER